MCAGGRCCCKGIGHLGWLWIRQLVRSVCCVCLLLAKGRGVLALGLQCRLATQPRHAAVCEHICDSRCLTLLPPALQHTHRSLIATSSNLKWVCHLVSNSCGTDGNRMFQTQVSSSAVNCCVTAEEGRGDTRTQGSPNHHNSWLSVTFPTAHQQSCPIHL